MSLMQWLLRLLRCKDYATVFATLVNSFVYPSLGLQVIITKVILFVPQPPTKACCVFIGRFFYRPNLHRVVPLG